MAQHNLTTHFGLVPYYVNPNMEIFKLKKEIKTIKFGGGDHCDIFNFFNFETLGIDCQQITLKLSNRP